MRNILFLSLTFYVLFSSCKVKSFYGQGQPVTHEIWDGLMKTHVSEQGWLDYTGIQRDSEQLNTYLNLLETHHPNPTSWSRNERMAYWINAYNAYTVKLILDYYPTESIKDIKKGIPFVNSVWDIEFIEIEGQKYSLNNLEHGILRPKFEEPRVHFAINCASYSCPALRNEAYVASRLDEQLTDAAKIFLQDSRRNKISPSQPQVSKIFSWFKGDFTKDQTLIEFINKYSIVPVDANADLTFLDYDWQLNDTASQN